MHYMLCKQKVADFDQWKRDFDSNESAREDAWLYVQNVWRNLDNPDEVFSLFEVVDLDRAKAFIDAAGSEQGGKAPGASGYNGVYFLSN